MVDGAADAADGFLEGVERGSGGDRNGAKRVWTVDGPGSRAYGMYYFCSSSDRCRRVGR